MSWVQHPYTHRVLKLLEKERQILLENSCKLSELTPINHEGITINLSGASNIYYILKILQKPIKPSSF